MSNVHLDFQFVSAYEVQRDFGEEAMQYLIAATPQCLIAATFFVSCRSIFPKHLLDSWASTTRPAWYICRHCGEEFHSFIPYPDYINRVCPDCWHAYSQPCALCGVLHHPNDIQIANEAVVNGEVQENVPICEHCYNANFFTCDDCGDVFETRLMDSYCIEDTGETLCRACYEQGSYFQCEDCGRYFSNEELYECQGALLCSSCYNEATEEDYGNERLNEYSYKPHPQFHSLPSESSRLYFGVENEFSFEDPGSRYDFLESCPDEDFYYFKEDSSLDYGAEMVTHPATLAWLQSHRDILADCFKAARFAIIQDGLHVHVSRKNMSYAHENRFAAFVYACHEQLYPVARRHANHYCQDLGMPETGEDIKNTHRHGRYCAVNFDNYHTVEVRIFAATRNVNTYLACVECVHAIYQFTKSCVHLSEILHEPHRVWRQFFAYISADKRYRELTALYLTPEEQEDLCFRQDNAEHRKKASSSPNKAR